MVFQRSGWFVVSRTLSSPNSNAKDTFETQHTAPAQACFAVYHTGDRDRQRVREKDKERQCNSNSNWIYYYIVEINVYKIMCIVRAYDESSINFGR